MTDQPPLDLAAVRRRANEARNMRGYTEGERTAVARELAGYADALVAEVDRLRAALVEIRDTRILGVPMVRTLDRIILVARKAIGSAS